MDNQKGLLVGFGLAIFLGWQVSASTPGLTDQSVSQDLLLQFLGAGAFLGFVVGLINLSKANSNPYKIEVYGACLFAGAVALLVNLYRGFIGADFGFNIIALISAAYIPSMVIGGYVSAVFSKSA